MTCTLLPAPTPSPSPSPPPTHPGWGSPFLPTAPAALPHLPYLEPSRATLRHARSAAGLCFYRLVPLL